MSSTVDASTANHMAKKQYMASNTDSLAHSQRPIVSSQVQSKILLAGMRVRKSINQGYQLPNGKSKLFDEQAIWDENMPSKGSIFMSPSIPSMTKTAEICSKPLEPTQTSSLSTQGEDQKTFVTGSLKRKSLITDYFHPVSQ